MEYVSKSVIQSVSKYTRKWGANQEYHIEKTAVDGASDVDEECWGAEGSTKRRKKTGWTVQRELGRWGGQWWQEDVDKQEVLKVGRRQEAEDWRRQVGLQRHRRRSCVNFSEDFWKAFLPRSCRAFTKFEPSIERSRKCNVQFLFLCL